MTGKAPAISTGAFPVEPGGLPGARGRAVAAQDLGPVPVPRGGGPVGVADQRPALPVNHDLMMKEADQNAIFETSFATVGLVLEVMHLASRRGLITSPRSLAVKIAGLDRVADPGRHIVAEANIQRLAGTTEPDTELAAAQEARQAAGARQQLDGFADDALLKRLAAQAGRQRLGTRHGLTRAGQVRGSVIGARVIRAGVIGGGVVRVGGGRLVAARGGA